MFISGHRARMFIQISNAVPVAFNFASVEIKAKNEPGKVPNSEGLLGNPQATVARRGTEAVVRQLSGGTVSIKQATFNTTASNPFAAPTLITLGGYIGVQIFPDFDGLPTIFHHIRSLYISDLGAQAEVAGLEPVDIEGVIDGAVAFFTNVPLVL